MTSAKAHLTQLVDSIPRSLPDAVYDALLEMLMNGDLPAGTPLAIDGISNQLNVSPTPVREALARLESTGLLERQARRGYRVSAPMSLDAMQELVDARMVLELGALERALRTHDALAEALRAAHVRHEEIGNRLLAEEGVLDPATVREYFERDWAFHQAILDHCGNRYLEKSVNGLSFGLHRMRQTLGVGQSDADVAIAEHRVILEAVERKDDKAALRALRKHLRAIQERWQAASDA